MATKEKKAATVQQIILERELDKTHEIDPENWFENCSDVNEAMREAGIHDLYLNWYSTEYDGAVHAFYFSDKIGERITLDSDVGLTYDTIAEMAETLIDYHEYAQKLEAKLPKITFPL